MTGREAEGQGSLGGSGKALRAGPRWQREASTGLLCTHGPAASSFPGRVSGGVHACIPCQVAGITWACLSPGAARGPVLETLGKCLLHCRQ